MNPFDRSQAAGIRRALLRWYGNRSRELPWRQSRSPYTVWVSEVMLQQTQIETVIPYYQRFVQEFPTVVRLAKAPLERVLELWSGLGYYRRARNLHCAAQEIVHKHAGQFPNDLKQVRSLPGIGDYTARAVLSIAYNQPLAVIDGNVARVMSRLLALRGSLHQPGFRRSIEENLDLLLSRRKPGDFNQAVMELGQTLCLPRLPRCGKCPVRKWCHAFKLRKPEDFPEPRTRRKTEEWYMATAVLHRNHRLLLSRGLDDGLLKGMWNFPSALGRSSKQSLAQLKKKLKAAVRNPRLNLTLADQEIRHNITYRSIRVQIYIGKFVGNESVIGSRWLPPEMIERAAVSQLTRKIVRKLASSTIEI